MKTLESIRYMPFALHFVNFFLFNHNELMCSFTFALQGDAGPVSPSFTALAELVSRIHPPTSRSSAEWLCTANSISNLLLSNSALDEYDEQDADIILARRARSGSLSDQDLLHDLDHSGVEEAGYEVSVNSSAFLFNSFLGSGTN